MCDFLQPCGLQHDIFIEKWKRSFTGFTVTLSTGIWHTPQEEQGHVKDKDEPHVGRTASPTL